MLNYQLYTLDNIINKVVKYAQLKSILQHPFQEISLKYIKHIILISISPQSPP